MQLHWETVPAIWYFIILAGIAAIAIQVTLRWRREQRKRRSWQSRRHSRIARARAWDWLMHRPKHRQLTDQRTSRDEGLPTEQQGG